MESLAANDERRGRAQVDSEGFQSPPCVAKSEDMKCEFCNADTVTRSVKKQHWYNGRLYIIENVDAEVCPECGERCFHATALDAIDQMIALDHPVREVVSRVPEVQSVGHMTGR